MYIKKNYQVRDIIPDTSGGSTELWQLQHYLAWIQEDINKLHRELTYWDIYKINYVIDDISKANSIINNLAPGQAAVIGFDHSDILNGEKRTRGDVVIKLIDNTLFWVPSKSSGIYKPDSTYSNNEFKYTYTNIEPPEGDQILVSATPSEAKNIYGHVFSLTANDISKDFPAVSNVRPLIRFYTGNNEIIDVNHILSFSSSTNRYTVTWIANPLLSGGILQVK